MKLNLKGIQDYGVVFSYDLLSKCIAALCNIFIIRMLMTEEYANYTLFQSIATSISGMIGGGITTGYLRLSVKNRSEGKNDDSGYYTLSMIAIWGITIILLASNSVFMMIYNTSFGIVVLSIIEAAVLSQCQLNVYLYQSREQFGIGGRLYNLRHIVLFFSLLLLFMLNKMKLAWHIMVGTIIAGFIVSIICTISFRNLEEFKFPSFKINKNEIKQLFFEIRWLVLYFTILALINAMDIIVLNKYTDSFYVANYGVAYKYYSLLLSLLPSITAVLRVRSSTKEYEESPEKRIDFIRRWLKKTGIIALIGIIVIPIVSFVFWNFVNGEGYSLAYWCFVIFMFGAMMSYMFSPSINFVLSAKKHKSLCLISIASLAFNIIGNVILVQKFSVIGVTITTIISQAIINIGGFMILLNEDKNSYIN